MRNAPQMLVCLMMPCVSGSMERICPWTNLVVFRDLDAEGVIVARKDPTKEKHETIDVPNLHVMKLMLSLKSRGYVRETFSWMWSYYYLTEEGIEYLREYLHLPPEIVPETHMKSQTSRPARPAAPGRGYEGDFRAAGKDQGPGRDFNPNFRAPFGRGGGAPGGDRDY